MQSGAPLLHIKGSRETQRDGEIGKKTERGKVWEESDSEVKKPR